jgi:hypothetical protein
MRVFSDLHRIITRDERGFAFAIVILVSLAMASLTGAAMMLGMTSRVVERSHERHSLLESVADDGLEVARARLNALPSLYPTNGGYVRLDSGAVTDALGDTIPGVTRAIYAGPVGITSGEYGVFGAIVSVAWDGGGAKVIRRSQVVQESFSRYAYFTNIEPSNIAFGSGDEIWGPVHSNDDIKIYPPSGNRRATFHNRVTTAGVVVEDRPDYSRSYGNFLEGVTERGPRIPMPSTAEFDNLSSQALAGGTAFSGSFTSATGRATLRIEFVAIDLNGDGDTQDADEGFMRVYRSDDPNWVVGAAPGANSLRGSRHCGHFHISSDKRDTTFVSAYEHEHEPHKRTDSNDDWMASLSNSRTRCFLGGDSAIYNAFTPNDGKGEWLRWTGPIDSRLNGRDDREYLFPITRALNPNFKGVVFVDGDVAVSGVLRGRVTLAATGDIIIADDLSYATDPALRTCADILGLFAGQDVVISNTPIHTPWRRGSGNSYFNYDDTDHEVIHAFVLALRQFWVEDFDQDPDRGQSCDNIQWGRGCLYLTGGIVQETRGPVGTTGGTGYLKRYSYDECGVLQPPPYFPTTGLFRRSQYFDVDPADFGDAQSYFNKLQAGNN